MPTTTTFSLLTFNCFGGLTWSTRRRLLTLASELKQLAPEIVCLQEVQSYPALSLLRRACANYPEHVYLPGWHAPFGSLLTLSRSQLSPPHFTRYATQGSWLALTAMDRLTQKGALVSHLQAGGIGVSVINTHLVANYAANWQLEKRAARDQQQQLHQLAALVNAQPAEALVLVAGDFNIPRGSWLYDEFLQLSGLYDPLAGDGRPTYRPFRGVPARYALPMDFVFVRSPAGLQVQAEANLHFTQKLALVGGTHGYLSDHLGVHVTLRWAAP